MIQNFAKSAITVSTQGSFVCPAYMGVNLDGSMLGKPVLHRLKQFAGIALPLMMLSGCVGPQPDEVLLPHTEISLTIKGDMIMEYDPATCQIGYNSERNEFRMLEDRLGNWFIFRSDATPTDVGQNVRASLEYTSQSSTKTLTDLTFSVEKVAPDGTTWLWNKDRRIGIIIKVI